MERKNKKLEEMMVRETRSDTDDIFTNAEEVLLLTSVKENNSTISPIDDQVQNEPIIKGGEKGMEKLQLRNERINFTSASKRRIRAYIRDGMTPTEAREKEKNRLEELKKLAVPPANSERVRSSSSTPESAPPFKKLSFDPAMSTIKNMSADEKAKEQGPSHIPQPSTSRTTYRDVASQSKVAITHGLHPEQCLTEQQMSKIKMAIMDEMDKADGKSPQFTAAAQRDGWLSITCNNKETRDWILSVGSVLKLWDGANIRVTGGDEMPRQHVCVAFVPADDTTDGLSKEKFIARLGKQNPSLNTKSWRVFRCDLERNGARTFSFSVDEASVASLQKMECRPFLNFSRIHVRIKGIKRVNSPTDPSKESSAKPYHFGRSEDRGNPHRSDCFFRNSDNKEENKTTMVMPPWRNPY